MNSFTVKSYWKSYKELSENIQKQADIEILIDQLNHYVQKHLNRPQFLRKKL